MKLTPLRSFVFVFASIACSSQTPPAVTPAPSPQPPSLSDTDWGRFRSERQSLSIPLPQGKLWRIDDHSSQWLDAVHTPTQCRVRARTWVAAKAMSLDRCEQEARSYAPDLPAVVQGSVIDTFESSEWFAPGFVSRVVVGIKEADRSRGTAEGYVLVFGVEAKRCLAMVFTATGAGPELGDRLNLGTKIAESTIVLSRLPGKGPLERVQVPNRE